MKSNFVADGRSNLRDSEEFQERLRQLREAIDARYAIELAHANFLRRWMIRWKMWHEYRRESKRLEPSPEALFLGGVQKSAELPQRTKVGESSTKGINEAKDPVDICNLLPVACTPAGAPAISRGLSPPVAYDTPGKGRKSDFTPEG